MQLNIARRGFSLIELMVVVAILGIMLALAAPGIRTWSANNQMRAVASSMQTAVKMAQAEAVKSARQVVLFRTNTQTCTGNEASVAAGRYYVIRVLPLFTGETTANTGPAQCGAIVEQVGTVSMSGPQAICFAPNGRLVAVADPGLGGAACTVPSTARHIYQVDTGTNESTNNQKLLQVWVTLGGSVRMCDRKRLATATADGCPEIDAPPTT